MADTDSKSSRIQCKICGSGPLGIAAVCDACGGDMCLYDCDVLCEHCQHIFCRACILPHMDQEKKRLGYQTALVSVKLTEKG